MESTLPISEENHDIVAPNHTGNDVEVPIVIDIADLEALGEGVGRKVAAENEVTGSVAKEERDMVESGRVHDQVEFPILVKVTSLKKLG